MDDIDEYDLAASVLLGVEAKISELTGLDAVPLFIVHTPNDFEDSPVAKVEIDCICHNHEHWFPEDEFCFDMPYRTIKGIARGDRQSLQSFLDVFMTQYCARAVEGELGLQLVAYGPDSEDPAIADHFLKEIHRTWAKIEELWPVSGRDWCISGLTTDPVSPSLTKVAIECSCYDEEDSHEILFELSWLDFCKIRDDAGFRDLFVRWIVAQIAADAPWNHEFATENDER